MFGVVGGLPVGGVTLGGPSWPVEAVVGAGRDTAVLRDIQARLLALGVFGEVRRHDPDELAVGADANPVAYISYLASDDLDDASGDVDVYAPTRSRWVLTIVVADDDPERRFDRLDQLHAICANALDGKSLGGITFPAMTKLTRRRLLPAMHPRRALVVEGEYVYAVESYAGHDERDPELL
jgi:hypothetical protein